MVQSSEKLTNVIHSQVGVLYTPEEGDPTPGSMYPRVIRLDYSGTKNGTLLATFEHYKQGKPVFPIYRSQDNGETWEKISEVHDTENGWGLRYQPHLFELPATIGNMPPGTLLIAGNSIPDDMSKTKIDIYKSTDYGLNWSFLSSIASGGPAEVYDDPVWEPFLYIDKYGDLVCYYSDERQKSKGFNQLLIHRSSKDGINWGPEMNDVAVPDTVSRPGMAIVSKLPNGKYMMTYEVVDDPNRPNCPTYYKFSDDGLDWGNPADLGYRVETKDGKFIGSTPYHIWTPAGGPNGMVIVSGKGYRTDTETLSTSILLVNYENGEGEWKILSSPISHDNELFFTGWSPAMTTLEGNKSIIRFCPVEINEKLAELQYVITEL